MTFTKASVVTKSNNYNDEREYFVFGKRENAEYFAEREQNSTVNKYVKDGETPVRFWTPSLNRCGVAVPSLFVERFWTIQDTELPEPMDLGQDCFITAYFKPDGNDSVYIFANNEEAEKATQSGEPVKPTNETEDSSVNAENATEIKSVKTETQSNSVKSPQIIKTLIK